MIIYILIYFVFLMSNPRNSTWFGLNSATFFYVKRSSSELCWLCCLGKSKLILNSFKWRLVSWVNPHFFGCFAVPYARTLLISSEMALLLNFVVCLVDSWLSSSWLHERPGMSWFLSLSLFVHQCVFFHICGSEDFQIGAGILLGFFKSPWIWVFEFPFCLFGLVFFLS